MLAGIDILSYMSEECNQGVAKTENISRYTAILTHKCIVLLRCICYTLMCIVYCFYANKDKYRCYRLIRVSDNDC